MKYLLLVLFLLSACSTTPPTHEEQLKADYGPKPSEESLKRFVGARLLDPYSAVYRFQGPCQGWIDYFGEIRYGWLATSYLNAKNAYGGYTGEEKRELFFYKGEWMPSTGRHPPGC